MTSSYREFYRGRRVMITGGLGFIGSNLARQLVELGADVLLIDSLIPGSGGNLFNIDGIADRSRVNIADVRQESTMNHLVRDREVIFNLAGQVSHIDSMRDPYTDLEINCRSQLSILEACRKLNPGGQGRVRRHAAGLRQARLAAGHRSSSGAADRRQRHQQGGGRELPPGLQQRVQRARLLAAADQRLRSAPAASGTTARGSSAGSSVWRSRAARSRSSATARRCAISSTSTMRPTRFCAPARPTPCNGQVFNVGGREPIAHRDLVALLIDVAGAGSVRHVAWPEEKKAIDIGSFYADSSRFRQRASAGSRACRCATASRGRSSTTARTAATTCRRPGAVAVA